MSSLVGMDLEGGADLTNALLEIPRKFRKQALSRAIDRAAQVFVSPMRQATPKAKQIFGKQATKNPPGTLRKATGKVVRTYRGGNVTAAYIGHKWPGGAAAHLLEKGTQERRTRSGKFRGRVVARPFFRPVFEQYKQRAMAALRDGLEDGLEKAVNASAKRFVKTLGQ